MRTYGRRGRRGKRRLLGHRYKQVGWLAGKGMMEGRKEVSKELTIRFLEIHTGSVWLGC